MVFARKRFAQHFLHDPAVVRSILDAIAAEPGQAIVEIGPGRGALTAALLEALESAGSLQSGSLDAIEIDRDLAAALRVQHGHRPALQLHVADALRFDFAALSTERNARLRVIGNLPYNVSTPLLFHLIAQPQAIDDLHIMLQREVIDRMSADPGTSEYGRLTVMLAPWVEVEKLFEVGPGAFRPAPRVWSAVARLRMRQTPAFDIPAAFARLVSTAFSARRKTLRNALRGLVEPAGFELCGIDPSARPETLSPAQFGALARTVTNS